MFNPRRWLAQRFRRLATVAAEDRILPEVQELRISLAGLKLPSGYR